MTNGPTYFASILPPLFFLAVEMLLEDFAANLIGCGVGMFAVIHVPLSVSLEPTLCWHLLHQVVGVELHSFTSDGGSSLVSSTVSRPSSAVYLRISMSMARVAFLPNISTNGVKHVDSCWDVL